MYVESWAVVGYSVGLLGVASDKEGGLCVEEIGADAAAVYLLVGRPMPSYMLNDAVGGSCPHFSYIFLRLSASSLLHRHLWGSTALLLVCANLYASLSLSCSYSGCWGSWAQ